MEYMKSLNSPKGLKKSLTANNASLKPNLNIRRPSNSSKFVNIDVEEPALNQVAKLKSTYDCELKYMQEYISVLKKKNSSYSESVNEKKLRDEISFLYENLKNEQQANLILINKINQKSSEKIEENYKKTGECWKDQKKIDRFKEDCVKKVEDCLGFYVRELMKVEEKMNRLELSLGAMKKEVKVIKSVLMVSYKKDLTEKKFELRENSENLARVLDENVDLKEKIKGLQKDVEFYRGENKKQREIIKEITEESEFERIALASVNKIKNSELFVFEKDEFFSEMMEKVSENCEKCKDLEQKLGKKEKNIENLREEVNRLKSENSKLLEDNENLEVITGKMQDILVSSDNRSRDFSIGSPVLSPKASGDFNGPALSPKASSDFNGLVFSSGRFRNSPKFFDGKNTTGDGFMFK